MGEDRTIRPKTHRDCCCSLAFPHQPHRVVCAGDDRLGKRKQYLSVNSTSDVSPISLEKLRPEFCLQASDLPAEGGLRYVHDRSRPSEATDIRNGHKGFEEV